MKKALLLAVLLLASLICRAENDGKITFAWLSDIHLNSFAYAREDLSDAIEDINGNPLIDFVIMSGDLTEFGDTREFMMLDTLLRELDRPYFMTTGNHDVNWSENGCTAFEKLLGPPHFCTEIKGYRFIGCGAGPALRMGPPQIPREELVWLDSVITATPEECPVIFINHFPIDESLCNAYEVSQILSKGNVKCVLSGHLHVNRAYDAGGIPGVIGRSTLRRADPAGGYNIVTVENGTISFRERIIKRETKPLWHEVALNRAPESGKRGIQAPDYSINREFPRVREVWKIADVADIASRGAISGNTYIYTNTAGAVHAVNAKNGKHIWSFKSGNKIFSAPCISGDTVIITSCDGYIYALTLEEGNLIWKHDTEYPIVATPAVAGGVVYTGSGNGKFHAIDLENGSLVWECSGLSGYIEAKPAVDSKNLYIGTWGAKFYATQKRQNGMGIRHRKGQILLPRGMLAPGGAVYRRWKEPLTGCGTEFRQLPARIRPRRRPDSVGLGPGCRTGIHGYLSRPENRLHKRYRGNRNGSGHFRRQIFYAVESGNAVQKRFCSHKHRVRNTAALYPDRIWHHTCGRQRWRRSGMEPQGFAFGRDIALQCRQKQAHCKLYGRHCRMS